MALISYAMVYLGIVGYHTIPNTKSIGLLVAALPVPNPPRDLGKAPSDLHDLERGQGGRPVPSHRPRALHVYPEVTLPSE